MLVHKPFCVLSALVHSIVVAFLLLQFVVSPPSPSRHLPATRFRLAKSFLYVHFSRPSLTTSSARASVCNALLAFLVRDSLTEYSYCGEIAGIFYTLRPIKTGMELR